MVLHLNKWLMSDSWTGWGVQDLDHSAWDCLFQSKGTLHFCLLFLYWLTLLPTLNSKCNSMWCHPPCCDEAWGIPPCSFLSLDIWATTNQLSLWITQFHVICYSHRKYSNPDNWCWRVRLLLWVYLKMWKQFLDWVIAWVGGFWWNRGKSFVYSRKESLWVTLVRP
jgi:hypothetical protein